MFRGTLGHIARILAWLVAMPFIPLGAVSAFADDSPKTPAPAAQTVAAPAPSAAQKPVRTAAGEKPANALKGDLTRTRFLIGLDKTVSYSVLSLNNPNRVVVELPDVPMHLPADPGADPVGLVKSFRGGLSAPGKTRIVIDVTQPVIVETARLEKGADGKVRQLAIEIVPAAAAERSARKTLKSPPYGLGASGVQPPLPQPAKRATGATQSTFKPIIVIDPGHGGDDTGAVRTASSRKMWCSPSRRFCVTRS